MQRLRNELMSKLIYVRPRIQEPKVKIIALKYRLFQIRFHFHPGKFSICYLSGKMKKR